MDATPNLPCSVTPDAPRRSHFRLRIDDLVRDQQYQIRDRLDSGAIERYRCAYASEAPMPPIKVALVSGAGVVVDGYHRLPALKKLGIKEVDVEAVEANERDALWLAAQANLQHGLPLKSRELRQVFRAYIRSRKHRESGKLKSYRDIARDLGGMKTHETIRNWMIKDFRKIANEMGGHEDFVGTGGIREVKKPEGLHEAAMDALKAVRAAARGVRDPQDRGRLIVLCEDVLSELKTDGAWEPSDF